MFCTLKKYAEKKWESQVFVKKKTKELVTKKSTQRFAFCQLGQEWVSGAKGRICTISIVQNSLCVSEQHNIVTKMLSLPWMPL